jgi:hypothetical protein
MAEQINRAEGSARQNFLSHPEDTDPSANCRTSTHACRLQAAVLHRWPTHLFAERSTLDPCRRSSRTRTKDPTGDDLTGLAFGSCRHRLRRRDRVGAIPHPWRVVLRLRVLKRMYDDL